jgi:cellulose synthase/poly-beta-1,6-N-acetylglucosamine synthase-like glycosyltransferase
MMSTAAEWVFVSAAVMLLFPHVGLPAIALLRAWLAGRPIAEGERPVPVSVILAAHGAADVIGARIRNLLEQEYPRDLVQVIVACDGGDDGTFAAAWEHAGNTVEMLDLARTWRARSL